MKKYIVLLSMVLFSCSTMKIEEQIVQDFVKEKDFINKDGINRSYLIEKAGSCEKVLNYYQIAYQDKDLRLDKKRIDFAPGKTDFNWSVDSNEIEVIKVKNKKNEIAYFWKSKNFKSLDIPIIDKKELLLKLDKRLIPSTSVGYVISKPVLSLNKEYAFVQYSGITDLTGVRERYYVMQKINGKWVIKIQLFDPNVFE